MKTDEIITAAGLMIVSVTLLLCAIAIVISVIKA